MPEVTQVTVGYERKVQIEQFEPVMVSCEFVVEIDEDDDPDEVFSEYEQRAEDSVERELARRITQKKTAESDDDG